MQQHEIKRLQELQQQATIVQSKTPTKMIVTVPINNSTKTPTKPPTTTPTKIHTRLPT